MDNIKVGDYVKYTGRIFNDTILLDIQENDNKFKVLNIYHLGFNNTNIVIESKYNILRASRYYNQQNKRFWIVSSEDCLLISKHDFNMNLDKLMEI